LAFWDDLDADFRRFYRIDGIGDGDYGDLSGPRFIALADRCVAYGGALLRSLQRVHAAAMEEEKVDQELAENDARLANLSDLIER
jgi:hypothetical protein